MRNQYAVTVGLAVVFCTWGCEVGSQAPSLTATTATANPSPNAGVAGGMTAGGASAPVTGTTDGGTDGGPVTGATWTVEDSGTKDTLVGVWGAGDGTVWAVGTHVILRSGGDGHWTPVSGVDSTDQYTAVFGNDGALFVAGLSCDNGLCDGGVLLRSHDDGATWDRQLLPQAAWGFSRGSDGTIYLALDGAVLASQDGFATSTSHTVGTLPVSHGVLAGGDQSGLLLAYGGLRSLEIRASGDGGNSWDVAYSGSAGSQSGHVDAAWAAGAHVWAVANAANVPNTFGVLLRSDDGGHSFAKATMPTMDAAHAVWGSGANDVYVAGTQLLHASDGAAFTPVTLPATGEWFAVWGSGASDVYVVGLGGAVVHLH